jgi:feruloyl esterase
VAKPIPEAGCVTSAARDFHGFQFTTTPGFDNDLQVTEDKVGAMFNATDPDLRPFRANGGKLIHYHGWSDPDIPPANSINYYESVVAALSSDGSSDGGSSGGGGTSGVAGSSGAGSGGAGGSASGTRSGGLRDTREFYRLFMVPGMQHCTGGPGTSRFDALAALEQWAEHSKAPEQIPAAHVTNGKVDRTRPLCPYPQEAKYMGTGSTDDTANFACALP